MADLSQSVFHESTNEAYTQTHTHTHTHRNKHTIHTDTHTHRSTIVEIATLYISHNHVSMLDLHIYIYLGPFQRSRLRSYAYKRWQIRNLTIFRKIAARFFYWMIVFAVVDLWPHFRHRSKQICLASPSHDPAVDLVIVKCTLCYCTRIHYTYCIL